MSFVADADADVAAPEDEDVVFGGCGLLFMAPLPTGADVEDDAIAA